MIKSMTIQFSGDSDQLMLAYAKPKSLQQAIRDAKRMIMESKGIKISVFARCAVENESFALFVHTNSPAPFGWVTMHN